MTTTVSEALTDGITRCWTLKKILYRKATPYQDIVIAETQQGVTLFCNSERQSAEQSQLIYHEGQVIPAALLCNKLDSALIIGSSEGVSAQMVVALGAKDVTHVDIDSECIEACARYLPYGYDMEELNNIKEKRSPIKLVIADGFEFVKHAVAEGKLYDLIVLDLPDEQIEESPQNKLYSIGFYSDIKKLLTPKGAFISQAGCSTWWRNKTLELAVRRFQQSFETSVYYEMEEQDWSWVIGTNAKIENPAETMVSMLRKLKYQPEFIDEISIRKATVIPLSIRKRIAGEIKNETAM
ncbi:spermidine synthase [Pseudomonas monteilii]|jgi:spermidine synthase